MTRKTRDPVGSTVRLADFDVLERLCFSSAWRPMNKPWDGPNTWRWPTWREYLADWRAIRAEFIAAKGARRSDGDPWFADLAAAYARQHGLPALEASNYYTLRGWPEPHDGETSDEYAARMEREYPDEDD